MWKCLMLFYWFFLIPSSKSWRNHCNSLCRQHAVSTSEDNYLKIIENSTIIVIHWVDCNHPLCIWINCALCFLGRHKISDCVVRIPVNDNYNFSVTHKVKFLGILSDDKLWEDQFNLVFNKIKLYCFDLKFNKILSLLCKLVYLSNIHFYYALLLLLFFQ